MRTRPCLEKLDIIRTVTRKTKFRIADVKTVLNCALDSITDELAKGNDVNIRSFCQFRLKAYKQVIKNDPRAGHHDEQIVVPEHVRVSFKPSVRMKLAVRKVDPRE